MQEETVLYIPSTEKFCVLNATAGHLWGLLEEPRTEEELSAELCRAFEDVAMDEVGKDVRDALAELTELDVVARVE